MFLIEIRKLFHIAENFSRSARKITDILFWSKIVSKTCHF